jgi:hypothetical protein
MRLFCILIIFSFTITPYHLHAAATTIPVSPPGRSYEKFTSLKIKEVQKLIGRRLSTKEKISFLILKHTARKKAKESNKGTTALVFGIAGVATLILGLFLPYVLLVSLVAAILAVVLGSSVKREDPGNKKANAAVLLGWITLGGIALLLILVAVAFATW